MNYVIDLRRKFSEFNMKDPDYFHVSYRAWSEAKLGPGFRDR